MCSLLETKQLPRPAAGKLSMTTKGSGLFVRPPEFLMMRFPKGTSVLKAHSALCCPEVTVQWHESWLLGFLTPERSCLSTNLVPETRGGSALPGVNFLSQLQPCHCPETALLAPIPGESHTRDAKSSGIWQWGWGGSEGEWKLSVIFIRKWAIDTEVSN